MKSYLIKILIYVLVNMGNSCCILFDIVTQNEVYY